MRARPSGILVALVLLATPPALASAAPPVRGWLEVGPSFDRQGSADHHGSGLGLAAGIELGRRWGLVASAGYEHYTGHVGPYLQDRGGQVPPTVIVEGDTGQTAWTGSLGLRWSLPAGPVEANLEAGIGGYNVFRHRPGFTDPGTGAVIFSGGTAGNSAPMGEFGFTLRTHRDRLFDGYVGLRLRGYSQIGEAIISGSTLQVRLGVLSR
jgi:hypothetical protein